MLARFERDGQLIGAELFSVQLRQLVHVDPDRVAFAVHQDVRLFGVAGIGVIAERDLVYTRFFEIDLREGNGGRHLRRIVRTAQTDDLTVRRDGNVLDIAVLIFLGGSGDFSVFTFKMVQHIVRADRCAEGEQQNRTQYGRENFLHGHTPFGVVMICRSQVVPCRTPTFCMV